MKIGSGSYWVALKRMGCSAGVGFGLLLIMGNTVSYCSSTRCKNGDIYQCDYYGNSCPTILESCYCGCVQHADEGLASCIPQCVEENGRMYDHKCQDFTHLFSCVGKTNGACANTTGIQTCPSHCWSNSPGDDYCQ